MRNEDKTMKNSYLFNRGLVYPGSIYGGPANAWDYGPYGGLKMPSKMLRKRFVTTCPHNGH